MCLAMQGGKGDEKQRKRGNMRRGGHKLRER